MCHSSCAQRYGHGKSPVIPTSESVNGVSVLTNVIKTKKSPAKNVLTRGIFTVHPPIKK